jgi:acyl carrier protein
MIDAQQVADALSTFIEKRFSVDSREPGFTRDVHLWHSGFLDSLALAEILAFLDSTFSVRVPDYLLVDESLGSINGMSGAVAKLIAKSKKS